MRIIFTFSLLSLLLCVGCPQPVPESNGKTTEQPVAVPDFNQPEPLVEPLVPRERPTEGTPEETTGIVAEVLGQYAAEIVANKDVPLPPLEDLAAQIDAYITKIEESLEYLDGSPRYAADSGNIVRDAHALALVALALGLAEEDSRYKKSASHIIAAAQSLAAAPNLEEGQKAHAALKASLTKTETAMSLAWSDRVAVLTPAMKALPNLSSTVKRLTDTPRKLALISEQRMKQVFSQLAAMAVISQGTIPNVLETTKPDAMEEWKQYCEEFRDAAIKANAVAHQFAKDKADGKDPDYAVFSAALKAMTESCDDCHKVFYPKAMGMQ